MQKQQKFIKFFRVAIWGIVAVVLPIAISLKNSAESSASYADGSYALKALKGNMLFWFILIIGALNLIWGIVRWILRWRREKWNAKKVIGKLIGGGVWRFFAIAPVVLISFFFLAGPVCRLVENQVISRDAKNVSSISKIESDFNDKLISIDEYILYTAKAAYAPSELPEKYQSGVLNMTPHLAEFLDEHFKELNEDTIKEVARIALYNNIDFDTDASSNLSTATSIFSNNAYAYTNNVTKLNKAKLSKNRNFVIFYTDTGDDKISDADAEKLGNMLEDIVDGYLQNLGEYFYYKEYSKLSIISSIKIGKVLANNGLDEDTLRYSMPVYVANPYKDGSSVLASYAGRKFSEFGTSILIKIGSAFGEETAELYNSTVSYPFINILPSNIQDSSLALVTAHELGHHFSSGYCYENFGEKCKENNFIDETLPNYMAIHAVSNQPLNNIINQNHYNDTYIKSGTGYPIYQAVPDFDGYPAVAFLENYGEIVETSFNNKQQNGYQNMLVALGSDNAIKTLSGNAGQQFYNVMSQLAERNLTNNYDSEISLKASSIPKGEQLPCRDYCQKEYNISPVALKYFYFSAKDYKNATITFTGPLDKMTLSVVGKKSSGEWETISSRFYRRGVGDGVLDEEYTIDGKYDVVAFVAANCDYESENTFTLKISNDILDDIIDEEPREDSKVTFDDPGEMFTDLGNGCYEAHLDSLFDATSELLGAGGELLKTLTELDPENDYTELKNQIDQDVATTQQNIAEAKKETEAYRIVLCAEYIKKGRSFDQTKSDLQKALGLNYNVYDEYEDNTRTSVFLGFDLINRSGKIYTLIQEGDELGLITIDVTEK